MAWASIKNVKDIVKGAAVEPLKKMISDLNIFGNVQVGDKVFAADGNTDTLPLIAGNNMTIQATQNGIEFSSRSGSGGSIGSIITITTERSELFGSVVTISDGDESFNATFNSVGKAYFEGVTSIGRLSVSCQGITSAIDVPYYGNYTFPLVTIYGFHIDGNESDPASRVSYQVQYDGRNVDNYNFAHAYMNYIEGKFDFGSWENAFFMPKPCMLKYDGTVDYYLDQDDYTKREDGVTASDVGNTAYNGNAMMEWGRDGKRIYYKVVPDEGNNKSATVYIADSKLDEDFKAYSFINNQGDLVDHFYTPIYNGSVVGGRLRSLSGQQISNKTTAAQEINYAKANNPNSDTLWYIEVLADLILINFLLILMGKSTDTQAIFGQGAHTGGTEAINNTFRSGVHNTKGMFYGTNSGTVSSGNFGNCSKIFGMENYPYGFQWRRLAGYINASGIPKIKLTYGIEDGSTVSGYNETGAGYIALSNCAPAGTSGGYISEVQFNEYGMFAKTASGSDKTYYCDGLWFNNSQTNFALVGGPSGSGAPVGAFCVSLSAAASVALWSRGAALSCKPLARG